MEGNDRLLSVREVASWLGMSTPWIYKECEKGALPFLRLGQAIRFDRKEIERYLQTRSNLKAGKDGNLVEGYDKTRPTGFQKDSEYFKIG